MIGDVELDPLEIREQEVVDAMRLLPQGHDIDWLGVKDGRGTFDRKDGVALQVYKSPGVPGDAALYSGDLAPAAPADGYDSTGYPTREGTLRELVEWLVAWDGSEVDLTPMLAEPAVEFPWVVARSEHVDSHLENLGTKQWRLALAALYLARGEYVPPLAKIGGRTATTGVTFGFCDGKGVFKPRAESTHAGWRFDEEGQ